MTTTHEGDPYHARAWEDIPAESDTISVFYLCPRVLDGLILALIHREILSRCACDVGGKSG